jgi:hypothetical protein
MRRLALLYLSNALKEVRSMAMNHRIQCSPGATLTSDVLRLCWRRCRHLLTGLCPMPQRSMGVREKS